MGKNKSRTNHSLQTISKTSQQTQLDPTIPKEPKNKQEEISQDVQSTWQVPEIDKSHLWERQTTHRDRTNRPNKKGGYGRGRNKFYTLPYETREELKNERLKAQKDAPMERIPENEELNHRPRFMKFDEKPTIDKNHIIGIHNKQDLRPQPEQRRNIFPSQPTRSNNRHPTIGINRVAPIFRKSYSEDSFFTSKLQMKRSNSYKNNLSNLVNEQNEASE